MFGILAVVIMDTPQLAAGMFIKLLTQPWQGARKFSVVASAVAPFIALAIPVNGEVGQSNWRRRPRQYARVLVVTTVDGEQLQNLCAFSGDGSILGLP